MSNPHRAQKDVTFGGKQRRFIFDFNALAEFEGELHTSIAKWMESIDQLRAMPFRDLRAMVWACLLKEPDHPTVNQVGDWLGELMHSDNKAFWAVNNDAMDAFKGFWPKPKPTNGELKNDQSPVEDGTGMPSSSRPDGSESNLQFSGE